jgi:ribA/ribD-fused uncharacterized protein
MNPILFYSVREPYGFFSNFARYPITLDGDVWATSEHYFQAAKFLNESDRQAVQTAKSSLMAARIGRDRRRPIRADWNTIKDNVMMRGLRAKFDQHSELREILISTQGAELVEHTKNDSYWGDGGDGSGQNKLGRMLVQIRNEYIGHKFDVGLRPKSPKL